MKAKVLILPDAKASFVSYLKRQDALGRSRRATKLGIDAINSVPIEDGSSLGSKDPKGVQETDQKRSELPKQSLE